MNYTARAILRRAFLPAGIVFSTVAFAQSPNTGSLQTGAAESGQIAEIIVTAERRAENLQQTPVAVTAFTAEDLTERNVRSLRDLIISTPNLEASVPVASDPGATVYTIRGLGQQRGGSGAQPAVGVYVDDFYYPSLYGSLLRVLDLSSVEVLRGPQGTLFGRNTIGGAIRYNTVMPDQQLAGHVEVTGGSFDRRDITGSVNLPLTDMLAVRLSGAMLQQGGFVKDERSGQTEGNESDRVVRAQVRFTPRQDLTIDLVGEYTSEKFHGESYVVGGIGSPPGSLPFAYNMGFLPPYTPFAPPPPAQQYDARYISTCKYCQPGSNPRDYSYSWSTDYRATVAWKPIEGVTFKSLTGYFDTRNRNAIDLDYTPLFIIQNVEGFSREISISQEFQASGAALDNRINWITGLYYYDYKDEAFRLSGVSILPPQEALVPYYTKSYAVYGQASWTIIDGLTATLGARGSRDKAFGRSDDLGPPGPPNTISQSSATFNDFSPMAKLQYQWMPEVMTYLSAEKGFRGGGVNTQIQLPPAIGQVPFAAEKVISYEAGARTEFLDRHLLVNLTGFLTDYKNIQLLIPFQGAPGSPIIPTVVENAGRARLKGVELEAQAVLNSLRLHATLSTLHGGYTELAGPGGTIPQGVTLTTRFQHAPTYTYSVGASYQLPLPVGNLQSNLDYGYQARQNSTSTNIDTQVLPPYGLLNGRVEYAVTKNWSAALAITNILNKNYFIGGADLRTILGASYFEPGAPREYAGTLQYKF